MLIEMTEAMFVLCMSVNFFCAVIWTIDTCMRERGAAIIMLTKENVEELKGILNENKTTPQQTTPLQSL